MDKENNGGAPTNHPYAGRWIARIRGQVVGQGGTPRQAMAAAYGSRHKEIPILCYIPVQTPMTFSPLVFRLQKIFSSEKDIFLVGGAIRDALLQRTSHDLDIICRVDARRLAKMAADRIGAAFYTMDAERGIFRVIHSDKDQPHVLMDFSNFRGNTLEEDLRNRDFTINAIASDIQDPYKLIDPLGGAQALKDHLVKACSPDAFCNDPVRILRGIRFASQWNFRIEAQTRLWMKEAVPHLSDVTVERRRDEFLKIMASGRPDTALRAVDWLGALDDCLAGLGRFRAESSREAWEFLLDWINKVQTLVEFISQNHPNRQAADLLYGMTAMKIGRFHQEVDAHFHTDLSPGQNRLSVLLLGVLLAALSDAIKDATLPERTAREMNMSRVEMVYLRNVYTGLEECSRIQLAGGGAVTPIQVFRYYRSAGQAGVDAALGYAAQLWAKQKITSNQDEFMAGLDVCQTLLDGWWNHMTEWVEPFPLLNGDELMRLLQQPPGPIIGRMLDDLLEKQVLGEIASREDAELWIKQQGDLHQYK